MIGATVTMLHNLFNSLEIPNKYPAFSTYFYFWSAWTDNFCIINIIIIFVLLTSLLFLFLFSTIPYCATLRPIVRNGSEYIHTVYSNSDVKWYLTLFSLYLLFCVVEQFHLVTLFQNILSTETIKNLANVPVCTFLDHT